MRNKYWNLCISRRRNISQLTLPPFFVRIPQPFENNLIGNSEEFNQFLNVPNNVENDKPPNQDVNELLNIGINIENYFDVSDRNIQDSKPQLERSSTPMSGNYSPSNQSIQKLYVII